MLENTIVGYPGSLVSAGTSSPLNKLANSLSQVRMGQETMSPGTQGHWWVQELAPQT